MPETPTSDSIDKPNWSALVRIMAVARSLSSQATFYTLALAAIGLAPETGLSGPLVGLGSNAISGILERLAGHQPVTDDEIRQAVQLAIDETGIDELLTQDEFQRALARLPRWQDVLMYAVKDGRYDVLQCFAEQSQQYATLIREMETTISARPDALAIQDQVVETLAFLRKVSSNATWSLPPEFAEAMRRRRPGYDKVFQLVQQYAELPSGQRRQLAREDLITVFVSPMFEAVGWYVQVGGGMSVPTRVPTAILPAAVDLVVSSHSTDVLVEVKGYGEASPPRAEKQVLKLASSLDIQWVILTDFDVIRIWDVRDLDRPEMILETSPQLYILDEGDEHDLLAAEIFYQRLVQAGPQPQPIRIATRALSDRPSEVDLLGFQDYAQALADLISYENTQLPLTIGIDAPWGMGKTTLLRMIKKALTKHDQRPMPKRALWPRAKAFVLRPIAGALANEEGARAKGGYWSQANTWLLRKLGMHRLALEEKGLRREIFHVVWFNAWKYDREESLWAALALEILTQVRRHFNLGQRFWLWRKLNWERFDRDSFMHDVGDLLVHTLVLLLLGFVVLGMAAIAFGTSLQQSVEMVGRYVLSLGVAGFAGALYHFGREVTGRLPAPFRLNITQYMQEPDYRDRIGFLGQFEADFRRVVRVITGKGKCPLVVFIDDLDRCAPPKPAEIIEAINLLLDAEHSIFIIGMDAQSTAASVETKYRDLKEGLSDVGDPGGLTLGQHFLEKIFQIGFQIPMPDPTAIRPFIDANLGALPELVSPTPLSEDTAEARNLIKAEQRTGKSLEQAVRIVRAARPDMSETMIEDAGRQEAFAQSPDDSADVREAIYDATRFLGNNPRKIKRFINTFRLQCLIANRRGLLRSRDVDLRLLARAVVIAMRWPAFLTATNVDPGFGTRLLETWDAQTDVRRAQEGGASEREMAPLEGRLNRLLSDTYIRQLIDASGLLQLLHEMDEGQIRRLPQHLNLAQITAPGVDRPEAEAN